jgi:hypothetical protein
MPRSGFDRLTLAVGTEKDDSDAGLGETGDLGSKRGVVDRLVGAEGSSEGNGDTVSPRAGGVAVSSGHGGLSGWEWEERK